MEAIDMLAPICLLLLVSLYIWAEQRLRQIIGGEDKRTLIPLWCLFTAATALPMLAMCFIPIPLPLFYMAIYGLSSLSGFLLLRGNDQKWLFVNLRFLAFAAAHLIVLGALSLCIPADIPNVTGSFSLRTLSLILAGALNTAVHLFLTWLLGRCRLQDIRPTQEELRLLSSFAWFCALTVFVDSIPCLFPLPTIFTPIFLIGSNSLLLLMAALFAKHVYTIMLDSSLREEALRLKEEAGEQHSRIVTLEREAYLDGLTGVYNRQYVIFNMNSMLGSGETFSLAFLDLDRLKQVNDRLGHLAGDEYLRVFSARMRERMRPNDVFARYGGDEFLILMPDLPAEDAFARLRPIREEAAAPAPKGWGIPFSFGLVFVQPEAGRCAEEWVAMADQAMYRDKVCRRSEAGRGL